MKRDFDDLARTTLKGGIILLCGLILISPLLLNSENIHIPRNPRLFIDYLEEENTYVFVISSATGDHIYRNITLEINGEVEHLNSSYVIERHVCCQNVSFRILMHGEQEQTAYSLNMTVEKRMVEEEPIFILNFFEIDNTDNERLDLENFPYRKLMSEVDEK